MISVSVFGNGSFLVSVNLSEITHCGLDLDSLPGIWRLKLLTTWNSRYDCQGFQDVVVSALLTKGKLSLDELDDFVLFRSSLCLLALLTGFFSSNELLVPLGDSKELLEKETLVKDGSSDLVRDGFPSQKFKVGSQCTSRLSYIINTMVNEDGAGGPILFKDVRDISLVGEQSIDVDGHLMFDEMSTRTVLIKMSEQGMSCNSIWVAAFRGSTINVRGVGSRHCDSFRNVTNVIVLTKDAYMKFAYKIPIGLASKLVSWLEINSEGDYGYCIFVWDASVHARWEFDECSGLEHKIDGDSENEIIVFKSEKDRMQCMLAMDNTRCAMFGTANDWFGFIHQTIITLLAYFAGLKACDLLLTLHVSVELVLIAIVQLLLAGMMHRGFAISLTMFALGTVGIGSGGISAHGDSYMVANLLNIRLWKTEAWLRAAAKWVRDVQSLFLLGSFDESGQFVTVQDLCWMDVVVTSKNDIPLRNIGYAVEKRSLKGHYFDGDLVSSSAGSAGHDVKSCAYDDANERAGAKGRDMHCLLMKKVTLCSLFHDENQNGMGRLFCAANVKDTRAARKLDVEVLIIFIYARYLLVSKMVVGRNLLCNVQVGGFYMTFEEDCSVYAVLMIDWKYGPICYNAAELPGMFMA